MKNILLTGGNGFIGRNIKEQLGERYAIFAPNSKELDLLDLKKLKDYLHTHEITTIIHAAIFNQKRRLEKQQDECTSNLKMFYNIIEQREHLDKIIYFGSGAEYDKRRDIVNASEESISENIPLLNDYGLSKHIMNVEACKSQNIYNMRLFGIYGPYENETMCFPSHLCRCALEGREMTIRQECLFDYLYIDDLMKPLEWLIENKPKYHDYNICSGTKVYLSKMTEIMNSILDKPLPVKVLKEGHNLEYTGLNKRIKRETEMPLTTIEEGLEKLYKFYKSKSE